MSLLTQLRCLLTTGKGVFLPFSPPTEHDTPIPLFEQWFTEAKQAGLLLPESMLLATNNAQGQPSLRTVLLKSFDDQGMVFFTNYKSKKALEMEAQPKVALLFHWTVLQRQVRIEGVAEKISFAESEAYFHSRGRGSQIGAWASKQSAPLDSRKNLEKRVQHFEEKFKGQTVPLPDFWGGYRVVPQKIEFWQGKADRLHDRFEFNKQTDDSWQVTRLNP